MIYKSTLSLVQNLCERCILAFVTLSEVEVRQMRSLLKVPFDKASTSLSLTNSEHEPSTFTV